MSFERNDNDRDWTEEEGVQWTKEAAKRDSRFDFAAFLGPDSLEDQVTDALDGKDLPDKDAYGQSAPDYVPRRGAPGERGRHEAPGSQPEEDEEDVGDGLPTQRFSMDGEGIRRPASRQDADSGEEYRREQPAPQRPVFEEPPPRPKVVVAGPAPRVYVTPERQYPDQEPTKGGGSGRAAKWAIALAITLVVLVAAIFLVSGLISDLTGPRPSAAATPTATPQDYLAGIVHPTPTLQPAPTQAPKTYYTVTVTAGSGGSISPGGTVDVEEGTSVTFSILPDEGYELAQLLVDGSAVAVQSSYTFSDMRQNHTIYAVFQLKEAPPVTDPPHTDVPETPVPTEIPPEPTVEPVTPEPAPPMEEGMEGDLGPTY